MAVTNWELRERQKLPLDIKIRMSQERIKEWYEKWDGQVYISHSGGKDSDVLESLVKSLYPDVPIVHVNTGLEYPENERHVKSKENLILLRPRKPFHKVITENGFPIISKEQSSYIKEYRNTKSKKLKNIRLYGNKRGRGKISEKWKYLIDAPFKISDECCDIIKKEPVKRFEKETGKKAFIGNLASESSKRTQDYLRFGCNAFNTKRPISRPIAFWTDDDIWEYIKRMNIKYSSVYDMGYDRTGCMFCMFGVHLEKGENRFQRMKRTHPKQWNYCMYSLGLADVLDYIGVPYKPELTLFNVQ